MNQSMQTKINQLSLVMTIPEDIVKACKQAGFPPAVTEVLIRLHNQQVEMEKAVNSLRSIQLQMAQLLDAQSTVASTFSVAIQELAKHTGYQGNEHVSAEEIGQG